MSVPLRSAMVASHPRENSSYLHMYAQCHADPVAAGYKICEAPSDKTCALVQVITSPCPCQLEQLQTQPS